MSKKNIKIGAVYKIIIKKNYSPIRLIKVKKVWEGGGYTFFYGSWKEVPERGKEFLIIPTRIFFNRENYSSMQEEQICEFLYNGKYYYTGVSGCESLFDSKYCSAKMVRVSNKNK